jgi:hypothetical protein
MASASSRESTPTISPSLPITRTRGTRISRLRRFCLSGVLMLRSPRKGFGLKPDRPSIPESMASDAGQPACS